MTDVQCLVYTQFSMHEMNHNTLIQNKRNLSENTRKKDVHINLFSESETHLDNPFIQKSIEP